MFVSGYPSGTGEAFVESELRHTFKFWEKIYLVRNNDEGSNEQRYVPENCSPIAYGVPNASGTISLVLRNAGIIFNVLFLELSRSRQKALFLSGLKKNLSLLMASVRMAEQLRSLIGSGSGNYFYSYWFNEWNLTLSILKHQKLISKNYTRAHGFDLYEDNGKPNYLPFRYFCMKNTDKVLTVSEAGSDYLKKCYPKFQKKIKSSYLGTEDKGMGPEAANSDIITLVSCGGLVDVKRPRLMIEILKKCSKQVIWFHIGDGHLRGELEELSRSLPKNVTCNFMGKLSQQAIFKFYSENYIDCFLNTSISEGLPVSIMEAISFGIPVIATNVGGTGEIVKTGITGHLVEPDFEFGHVAGLIENIRSQFSDRRAQIRQFWMSHFNAETNYTLFTKELTE
jgi:glycosyltransferase involved in cell wall biosynthesis